MSDDSSDDWATTSSSSADAPLVQFARFEDGQVNFFHGKIEETQYIAISHVWGMTEWLQMRNMNGEKLISRSKAKFVENRLEALVGNTAFWMDTLTVNQRDQEEVIAIVQLIPSIFRNAIRTIALRENDGFYTCCMEALSGFQDWGDFQRKWGRHIQDTPSHQCHIRTESYLQRLWTLQECLLSHTIQFVTPKPNQPRKLKKKDPLLEDIHRNYEDAIRLADSLYVLAYSFTNSYIGDQGVDGILSFLHAYIDGGTVVRTRGVERSETENIHTDNFKIMHGGSNRVATEPRDYVFATMPQFPWYHYPLGAENMPFSDIFFDLHLKASRASHAFACKFTQSMTDTEVSGTEAWFPSKDQPNPECLGDFLKLFGQPITLPKLGEPSPIHVTKEVYLIEDLKQLDGSLDEIFDILEAAMRFSEANWSESQRGGELSKYGSYPDYKWTINILDAARSGFCRKDSTVEVSEHEGTQVVMVHAHGEYVDDESWYGAVDDPRAQWEKFEPGYVPLLEHSRRILALMWGGLEGVSRNPSQEVDWKSFKGYMRGKWSKPLLRTILLLAAMVGCEIGLSAATWVRKRFVPVLVHYGNHEKGLILGLLARHPYENCNSILTPRQMYSVGRHVNSEHGKGFCQDLVLVDPERKMPVGILPNFLPHVRSNEMFVERVTLLYQTVKSEDCESQPGGNITVQVGCVSLDDV